MLCEFIGWSFGYMHFFQSFSVQLVFSIALDMMRFYSCDRVWDPITWIDAMTSTIFPNQKNELSPFLFTLKVSSQAFKYASVSTTNFQKRIWSKLCWRIIWISFEISKLLKNIYHRLKLEITWLAWKFLANNDSVHVTSKATHKCSGFSQISLWKWRVMAISNSPHPDSDTSNGGDSNTLVGLLKLACNWKTARFTTTPRSSFVAPRT